MNAFSVMNGQETTVLDTSASAVEGFGADHSNQNKMCNRAKWDDAEIHEVSCIICTIMNCHYDTMCSCT